MLKYAREHNYSYAKAFRAVRKSGAYKKSLMAKYDMRDVTNRKLEMARAFLSAHDQMNNGHKELEALAKRSGISEWTSLDKERVKIRFDGQFDLLIAVVSAIIRIYKRMVLELNDTQAMNLAFNALETIQLVCLDLRVCGGSNHDSMRGAFVDMVAKLSLSETFYNPVRVVRPNAPMEVEQKVVDEQAFYHVYKDKVKHVAANVVSAREFHTKHQNTSMQVANLADTCRDVCFAYNVYIPGVGHVDACDNKDAGHLEIAHVCAVCSGKHQVYNCKWLRAFMKIEKFDPQWRDKSYNSKWVSTMYFGHRNNNNRGGGYRGGPRGGAYRGGPRGGGYRGDSNADSNMKSDNSDKKVKKTAK